MIIHRYYRYQDFNRKTGLLEYSPRGGITFAIKQDVGGNSISFAICSKEDVFSKTVGKNISTGRMLAQGGCGWLNNMEIRTVDSLVNALLQESRVFYAGKESSLHMMDEAIRHIIDIKKHNEKSTLEREEFIDAASMITELYKIRKSDAKKTVLSEPVVTPVASYAYPQTLGDYVAGVIKNMSQTLSNAQNTPTKV